MKQKRDALGRFAQMPAKPKPPIPARKVKAPSPNMIRVKARHGTREIPSDRIIDETRYVYQNGQCFSLAIVLAERLGTDVGLLVSGSEIAWGTKYDDPEQILNLDHYWFRDTIHAIALTEDSTEDESLTLDIDGERDMAGVREEFIDMHSGTLIRIKPAELRSLLTNKRRGTGFL